MLFYVPTIGDKIYLKEDWTFDLYKEHRNGDMANKLNLIPPAERNRYYYGYPQQKFDQQVTLPAKTCLIVDRIYIRKGSPDYDSITFRIETCSVDSLAYKNEQGKKIKGKTSSRFWVKLKDANRIKCDLEPVADTQAPAATSSRFADI